MPTSHARIHAVVRRIPHGTVATYGQVATLAGLPGQARLVGYALHALAESTTVPWHRVVNAQGRVSARADGGGAAVVQRLRLEREGVAFDASGRLSLATHRWHPETRPPRRTTNALSPAPRPPRPTTHARRRSTNAAPPTRHHQRPTTDA